MKTFKEYVAFAEETAYQQPQTAQVFATLALALATQEATESAAASAAASDALLDARRG